jgi:hypothetical protein
MVGCSQEVADDGADVGDGEEAYTSASGRLLDLEFDAELLTDGAFDPRADIKQQLLFTIGHLNFDGGVGRLDKVSLTNVRTEAAGAQTRVRYHAKLPVSWGKKGKLPTRYTLTLPKRVDFAGQEAFFQKYSNSCVDPFAHDNEVGIYWYYYRPSVGGCSFAADDVVRVNASARFSRENSTGKYPEYDRIWQDRALKAVVIFGKVEDGATTDADRGIWSYNLFVNRMKQDLPNATSIPATFGDAPGIATPEITVNGRFSDGRTVSVTSFLVDNVREGGPAFEAKYNALSTDADVIIYNGHAGLGQNVRKLATMGTFKSGKYQIFYMNGCDTFAYVDGSMAQTRARLNPDDPTGTKYMEILTNSMPPNWDSLPLNSISLLEDLTKLEAPLTYKQILGHFDQSGVITVTGEEDNTFRPQPLSGRLDAATAAR